MGQAIRLAVFDCDGTLVDSQANICRAMELAFDAAGLAPPPRPAIRGIVGLSLVEAVTRLAPELDAGLHAAIAEDYKRQFQTMRARGALADEPLFDGVAHSIAQLIEAGWLLGVATGKSDRGLGFILQHHGLADHFVTLQTADRHPSKPHPGMLAAAMDAAGALPEQTVMIGDTSYDMAMAVNAGVHAIGVSWGYHNEDELRAAGAAAVCGHARELFETADALVREGVR